MAHFPFDLDSTLVDTSRDPAVAVNYAIAIIDRPAFPPDQRGRTLHHPHDATD